MLMTTFVDWMTFANNLDPDQAQQYATICWAWSGSKLFDTLMVHVFLISFIFKVNVDNKNARKATQYTRSLMV